MQISNIKDFENGWIVGTFEPALVKTKEIEFAHHFYSKGFKGEPHIHKVATEHNYIINGKVLVGDNLLSDGFIFSFGPNEYYQVEFLQDTNLLVIKTPSVPGDKYPI